MYSSQVQVDRGLRLARALQYTGPEATMNQTNQIQTHDRRREQLVITNTVETAGCVSYWRITSDTSLATLTAAWQKHGLNAEALPKPVKDEVALGRAVADQAGKRILVRPLARRGAWAIVQENVTSEKAAEASEYVLKPITYRTLVTITFANGCAQPVQQVEATSAELSALAVAIDGAYTAHRGTLAHSDVSSWLLDTAAKLGSVSLRDSGGIYFIPRKEVEIWNKVASALEETGSVIFRIPAMRTAECVAAITDAISAEAAALTQSMEDELMATGDDALGVRALKTRAESALGLLDKLSTYEELIGRQLDIRKRVELLSANIAAAALTSETASESA